VQPRSISTLITDNTVAPLPGVNIIVINTTKESVKKMMGNRVFSSIDNESEINGNLNALYVDADIESSENFKFKCRDSL
jgi:hypothetical protein